MDPMRGGIGRDRSRTLHAAIKKMGIRVEGGAEPGDEGYKENFYNFAEKNKLLLRGLTSPQDTSLRSGSCGFCSPAPRSSSCC